MTLADLFRLVLEELTVVAAGEPAHSSDVAVIANKWVAVYGQLSGLRLVSWAVTEEVPDDAVLPLISMLSFASSRDFGKDPAKYADGAIGLTPPMLAERQLRQRRAKPYVAAPAESEYF